MSLLAVLFLQRELLLFQCVCVNSVSVGRCVGLPTFWSQQRLRYLKLVYELSYKLTLKVFSELSLKF